MTRPAPAEVGWRMDLPVALTSGNRIKRALHAGDRRHYKRIRSSFAWTVLVAARGIPKAEGKREVVIVRLLGPRQRLFDPHDNLPLACKPLVDELVAHGLLVDDRGDGARILYGQERGYREPGVRVYLKDLPLCERDESFDAVVCAMRVMTDTQRADLAVEAQRIIDGGR